MKGAAATSFASRCNDSKVSQVCNGAWPLLPCSIHVKQQARQACTENASGRGTHRVAVRPSRAVYTISRSVSRQGAPAHPGPRIHHATCRTRRGWYMSNRTESFSTRRPSGELHAPGSRHAHPVDTRRGGRRRPYACCTALLHLRWSVVRYAPAGRTDPMQLKRFRGDTMCGTGGVVDRTDAPWQWPERREGHRREVVGQRCRGQCTHWYRWEWPGNNSHCRAPN